MSPMVWVYAVGLFVIGACIGSFLNVCIYRLPEGLSIAWPPSHCPKCKKRIAWYDNIPILSYFILRGRCRQCGATFSFEYAAIEIFTALVFAGFYWAYFVLGVRGQSFSLLDSWGQWIVYLTHMALACALIVSSAIDFKLKEIFTVVTNGGMVVAVVLCGLFPELQAGSRAPEWFTNVHLNAVVPSLLGLVVGGGLIWITAVLGKLVFRREAMGFGDVLLVGLIGAVLGWEAALLTFFVAPFFGLVYGLWHLARHRDHEVPYGPFLSMAAGVVMLTQVEIVAWFAPGLAGFWEVLRGAR